MEGKGNAVSVEPKSMDSLADLKTTEILKVDAKPNQRVFLTYK
jgi:hypothetical protein